MSYCIVIPARYNSSRLPHKPLQNIGDISLIERVYRSVADSPGAKGVYVATDDARIGRVVEGFNGPVVYTSAERPSGTDRVAEAVERLGDDDLELVVNLQGDLLGAHPGLVRQAIDALQAAPDAELSTLARPEHDPVSFGDPAAVKVVCDRSGRALFFSRAPIPASSNGRPLGGWLRHVGIYAFRREALRRFAAFGPTPLEQAEGLEQLRALEHGMSIAVGFTEEALISIDTPDDLERARSAVAAAERAGAHSSVRSSG